MKAGKESLWADALSLSCVVLVSLGLWAWQSRSKPTIDGALDGGATDAMLGFDADLDATDGDFDGGTDMDGAVEPDCAATNGARCFYVAPDGDDNAQGTMDAPFKTFRAALVQAAPGDFIYARGGEYGRDNAMLANLERLPQNQFSPPCAADQTEADGYCQVPRLEFISIKEWDGYPDHYDDAYSVVSGEPERPITIRNFPGERPVLDMASLARSQDVEDALIERQKPAISIGKSHWVIRGFEVIGGSINLYGNIEDITIQDCEVHDLVRDGGDNPGLIRINRGPEFVRILHNRLYGLSDYDFPGIWDDRVVDAQHFGAVTMLSGETYGGTDDTGRIDIQDNEMFHVPQVFFFKNAARGPIEITGNYIHDSGRLAGNVASNVHVAGNLVVNVATGFWRQGQGFTELGDQNPEVMAIDGQNLTIEYNTFVGLEGTLVSQSHGTGRVLSHNVIFGLPDTAASANWDSSSYIKGGDDFVAASALQSDDNCFIVPDAGFQHVAVYRSDGVDHYDIQQGRSLFGLDLSSVVVVSSDVGEVFTDPDSGDYSLLPTVGCSNVGYLS